MNTEHAHEPSLDALVKMIADLGGGNLRHNGGQVDFELSGIHAMAYVKPGGDHLRGSVYLDGNRDGSLDESVAEAWVARQPTSRAGHLEVVRNPDGGWLLRLLFERPLDWTHWRADDPLAADCDALAAAWDDDRTLTSLPSIDADFSIPGDPRDLLPRSAWLLLGDGASFPSAEELNFHEGLGEAGIHECLWTSAKQTAPGDLAFVYFTSPRKHVAFVARAASGAFYDGSIEVNADKMVRDEQWWTYLSPLVPITPITYQTLVEYADGHLPLKGRSGVYLRPEMVDKLIAQILATDGLDGALQRVLRPVAGLADLPSPERMTVEEWKALSPGALPLEKHVEQYVVEPLARFVLPAGHSIVRQHRIGPQIADYAVLNGRNEVRSVIEVKIRVRRRQDAPWSEAADFKQVQRYAQALGCPAALVDCSEVHLIAVDGSQPDLTIQRSRATARDLLEIGRHLAGE